MVLRDVLALALVLLVTACSGFPWASKLKKENAEYVHIRLQTGNERHRRSASMPEELHFRFTMAKGDMELRLKRSITTKESKHDVNTDNKNNNFPVFVIENGTVSRSQLPPIETGAVYENDTMDQLFVVRRNQELSGYLLEGVFYDAALDPYHVIPDQHGFHWIHKQDTVKDFTGDYIDNSVTEAERKNSTSKAQRPPARSSYSSSSTSSSSSFSSSTTRQRRHTKVAKLLGMSDAFLHYHLYPSVTSRRRRHASVSRHKRAAVSHYEIQLFMVADFRDYEEWLTYYNNNRTQTVREMHTYYSFIANWISQRYRSIGNIDPDLKIDILTTGLLIVKSAADAPWTEGKIRVFSGNPRHFVEANSALENFSRWINQDRPVSLPDSDHWMLFTGHDIYTHDNPHIAGLAKLGGLCTYNSVSIIEQDNTASVGATAAHELGHSLSAIHDGHYKDCRDEDNYIMSRKLKTPDVERLASRPWQFSPCSVRAFRHFLSRKKCGRVDNRGINLLTTELEGGQVFSADHQCKLALGKSSFFGRRIQHLDQYQSMCRRLFCAVPWDATAYQAIFAMEKTTCGNRKWCVQGKCIPDARAPPALDNCPQGDAPNVRCRRHYCRFKYYKDILCCHTCRSDDPDSNFIYSPANMPVQLEKVTMRVPALPEFKPPSTTSAAPTAVITTRAPATTIPPSPPPTTNSRRMSSSSSSSLATSPLPPPSSSPPPPPSSVSSISSPSSSSSTSSSLSPSSSSMPTRTTSTTTTKRAMATTEMTSPSTLLEYSTDAVNTEQTKTPVEDVTQSSTGTPIASTTAITTTTTTTATTASHSKAETTPNFLETPLNHQNTSMQAALRDAANSSDLLTSNVSDVITTSPVLKQDAVSSSFEKQGSFSLANDSATSSPESFTNSQNSALGNVTDPRNDVGLADLIKIDANTTSASMVSGSTAATTKASRAGGENMNSMTKVTHGRTTNSTSTSAATTTQTSVTSYPESSQNTSTTAAAFTSKMSSSTNTAADNVTGDTQQPASSRLHQSTASTPYQQSLPTVAPAQLQTDPSRQPVQTDPTRQPMAANSPGSPLQADSSWQPNDQFTQQNSRLVAKVQDTAQRLTSEATMNVPSTTRSPKTNGVDGNTVESPDKDAESASTQTTVGMSTHQTITVGRTVLIDSVPGSLAAPQEAKPAAESIDNSSAPPTETNTPPVIDNASTATKQFTHVSTTQWPVVPTTAAVVHTAAHRGAPSATHPDSAVTAKPIMAQNNSLPATEMSTGSVFNAIGNPSEARISEIVTESWQASLRTSADVQTRSPQPTDTTSMPLLDAQPLLETDPSRNNSGRSRTDRVSTPVHEMGQAADWTSNTFTQQNLSGSNNGNSMGSAESSSSGSTVNSNSGTTESSISGNSASSGTISTEGSRSGNSETASISLRGQPQASAGNTFSGATDTGVGDPDAETNAVRSAGAGTTGTEKAQTSNGGGIMGPSHPDGAPREGLNPAQPSTTSQSSSDPAARRGPPYLFHRTRPGQSETDPSLSFQDVRQDPTVSLYPHMPSERFRTLGESFITSAPPALEDLARRGLGEGEERRLFPGVNSGVGSGHQGRRCLALCQLFREPTLNSGNQRLDGMSRFFRSRMETTYDRLRHPPERRRFVGDLFRIAPSGDRVTLVPRGEYLLPRWFQARGRTGQKKRRRRKR